MASSIENMSQETRQGVATILAIGTANPPNCFCQSEYPDFYFQLTNSQHMTQLKQKFQRICERSAIQKRYMHLSEDMIKGNPNLSIYRAPSLDVRQEILITEVPKLGKEAALKAIKEWGQPLSNITHLIFCTSCCATAPTADYHFANLIGLKHSIQKFFIYGQGCYAAGTALRLSKDLVENNVDSRVLIVCSELMLSCFHAPSETHLDILVGSAIFSDGAAALIVGANLDTNKNERPLFEIISANQTVIPDSETMMHGKICEMGINYYISKELPKCIANNIEQCLIEMFTPFGINDWNTLFYVVHNGGPTILRGIEEKLGLDKDKLEASWHVLREYGNMWSPSVLFALDEMRKMSIKQGKSTTGQGLEWGVLLALGPGLTVETIGLRSCVVAGYASE